MHNSRAAVSLLLKLVVASTSKITCFRSHNLRVCLFLQHSSSSSSSSPISNGRSFCGYTAEQFSDDEYECDFESQIASSLVANIDEWKWKLSLLLHSDKDQEIVSRDKRDRRDYEQISNLAKRMGLYSEIYGKVVVASKVPLPNYRPDLDDKRPQREVLVSQHLQQKELQIKFTHYDHHVVLTVDAQEKYVGHLGGRLSKNLFFKVISVTARQDTIVCIYNVFMKC